MFHSNKHHEHPRTLTQFTVTIVICPGRLRWHANAHWVCQTGACTFEFVTDTLGGLTQRLVHTLFLTLQLLGASSYSLWYY